MNGTAERSVPRRGGNVKVKIDSLAFGGDGVGRLDGKVCFVPGALPGEEVVFETVKETSDYIKGRLKEILIRSSDRVEPVCPYYGKCGGCQTQHLAYEKEVFFKQSQLFELLKRIARENDPVCLDMERSGGDGYGYRSSITLHRKNNRWGFYGVDGATIIPVDRCPIADEAINAELGDVSAPEAKDNVTLKTDWAGKVWMSDRPGERFFSDRYLDKELLFSPKAFSQANRHISERIALTLEEWIGPRGEDSVFFDAYCGVGFYTFLSAGAFASKVGMDVARTAIECAKSTAAKDKRDNARFYVADAEKEFQGIFERQKGRDNVVFLDPPRKGASKEFLESISVSGDVGGIYYLSCDPARLARDVRIISSGGKWKMSRVKPFDMFPRTRHIEALAEFVKK